MEKELEKARERIEKARLTQAFQVNQANIREQIHENDQSLEEVLEELRSLSPDERDSSRLEEKVNAISNTKIERLGPINLAALEEYESQTKRKEYFDVQNEDLEKALNTLESDKKN